MTTISFYNGLKEIGGTFVAVETEKAKCMFDFGFAVAGRLDSRIHLRKGECAADYVRLGSLAAEDGIYEKKTAEKLGLAAYGETQKECFLVISHMHIDHMGGLGTLHPDIPVYMSEASLKLYRRLAVNGEAEVREHKNCIGIADNASVTIGDITVTQIPVDHDVIGACGFLITTPDGTAAYTGDYRFHGYHPDRTMAFAKKAAGADVLITEGVTVSNETIDMLSLEKPEGPERTEEGLLEEMNRIAEAEDGLVIINPYNRNVERIHHLLNALKENGRTLVLDGIQADYVAAFYPEDEICVYEPTARKGESSAHTIPDSWHIVSREELLAAPGQYVLQLDYSDHFELLDLKPAVSRYVHMDGAPLGSYDPSYQKLQDLLAFLEIPYDFRSLGGHAKPWYLRLMVDTIAPKTLIPLHSFRPEQVNSAKAGCRILPEYGDCYQLENGTLVKR